MFFGIISVWHCCIEQGKAHFLKSHCIIFVSAHVFPAEEDTNTRGVASRVRNYHTIFIFP